ncbi:MAG: cobaltochelatase subunit CobN [Alphaproteobacteria bacterium]
MLAGVANVADHAHDHAHESVIHQTAGDVIFLSAADSELSLMASARHALPPDLFRLRIANPLQITDAKSLHHFAEHVVSQAQLVILRLLGGRGYWSHGVDALVSACAQRSIPLALLPGDEREDEEMASLSTLDNSARAQLLAYCNQGGFDNYKNLLLFAAAQIHREVDWQPPRPILAAAPYWPQRGAVSLAEVQSNWRKNRPMAAILFYRAFYLSGETEPINALVRALEKADINPLPIFVQSLRDAASRRILEDLSIAPDLVINTTGFALVRPGEEKLGEEAKAVHRTFPTAGQELQVALAGISRKEWMSSSAGLPPRELAMNVALPEVDGRVFASVVSFKEEAGFDPLVECEVMHRVAEEERATRLAQLASGWTRLAKLEENQRRIAFVVANYPARDGRLANGVGLDTPESLARAFRYMRAAGYNFGVAAEVPSDGACLMARLLGLASAADPNRNAEIFLSGKDYEESWNQLSSNLREAVINRWGKVEEDPFFRSDSFVISGFRTGKVFIGIQPSRGYHLDPAETYHDPALVPPHGYLAFYFWLKANADVVVQFGKHGNLEWLPGKSVALSQHCWPDALLGGTPLLYPFIVNDPGEGTQAKRRNSAVILDHLTPPLARAESYGALATLESLMDEYYEAVSLDPTRSLGLRHDILEKAQALGLDKDIGLDKLSQNKIHQGKSDGLDALAKLDNHLCELKEMQIRGGLHIYGDLPDAREKSELIVSLLRCPRGSEPRDQSLLRALADDLKLGFDPLLQGDDAPLAAPYEGVRPTILQQQSDKPWRSVGDAVERLEILSLALVEGHAHPNPEWKATQIVLNLMHTRLIPALERCGTNERKALLSGLAGQFIAPGPSGAPSRGRPEVLPTGRNFYSLDPRAVPTPSAWSLGWRSAQLLVERYRQDHGNWPRHLALSAWGTANLRTGGDDIAQALALIGVQPQWDNASRRVIGFEVMPISVLGRPRVDLTLRISGFFRDAFPAQTVLIDKAVRAVAAMDESAEDNPLAHTVRETTARLRAEGLEEEKAKTQASRRVFGSAPGTYGAGLQALIDSGAWHEESDLAEAWLGWSAFAYGAEDYGAPSADALASALSRVEAVVHNQDNREHDILDSDDYYQFEGGMTAAVRSLSGDSPVTYHNDHSRPWAPRVRTLGEEIGRVVRARAANPKWIKAMMRHGYKGGFEMAATVDYLFAFAATTTAVQAHHFDALYEAYLEDDTVRDFLSEANPAALAEMAARLIEAQERALWHNRSNHVRARLESLASGAGAGKTETTGKR